jgi:hypothetical protein
MGGGYGHMYTGIAAMVSLLSLVMRFHILTQVILILDCRVRATIHHHSDHLHCPVRSSEHILDAVPRSSRADGGPSLLFYDRIAFSLSFLGYLS